MATAIVSAGVGHTTPAITKDCSSCDTPIHPARIAKHPNTELCARCQEKRGDVPTFREPGLHRRVYGGNERQKFGLSDPDAENAGTVAAIPALTWSDITPIDDASEVRVEGGRKAWATREANQGLN